MVPKISRLEPIVSIGKTILDEETLKSLLKMVHDYQYLKQRVSELATEFQAIKTQLANRSTDLAELEDVAKNLQSQYLPAPATTGERSEKLDLDLKALVGLDVDMAVAKIKQWDSKAHVVKVVKGAYVPYIYQFNRMYVFYDEQNKVTRTPEFG